MVKYEQLLNLRVAKSAWPKGHFRSRPLSTRPRMTSASEGLSQKQLGLSMNDQGQDAMWLETNVPIMG